MSAVNNNPYTLNWNDVVNRAYNKIPPIEMQIFNEPVKDGFRTKGATGMSDANFFIARLKTNIEQLNSTNPKKIDQLVRDMIRRKIWPLLEWREIESAASLFQLPVDLFLHLRSCEGEITLHENSIHASFIANIRNPAAAKSSVSSIQDNSMQNNSNMDHKHSIDSKDKNDSKEKIDTSAFDTSDYIRSMALEEKSKSESKEKVVSKSKSKEKVPNANKGHRKQANRWSNNFKPKFSEGSSQTKSDSSGSTSAAGPESSQHSSTDAENFCTIQ